MLLCWTSQFPRGITIPPKSQKVSSYITPSQGSSSESEGVEVLSPHSVPEKCRIQHQASQWASLKKKKIHLDRRQQPSSEQTGFPSVLSWRVQSQGTHLPGQCPLPLLRCEGLSPFSPREPCPSAAHGTQPRGSQGGWVTGETWVCFNVIASGYPMQNACVISGSCVWYKVFLINL